MVTPKQHSFPWKSGLLCCAVNKLGELGRSLSGVAANLIHLARGGLDMQSGFIFHSLSNRRRDDAGVSRADSVHPHFREVPIETDDLLQSLACALGLRFHG